jgi:hypothetical protein
MQEYSARNRQLPRGFSPASLVELDITLLFTDAGLPGTRRRRAGIISTRCPGVVSVA